MAIAQSRESSALTERRTSSGRPEFRFTREGRIFVVVTFGVGLGAVNTGNNLLYLVLGLLLGLLLTSGVLSEVVLRGVAVRRLAPPRLFVGRRGLFELEVTNEKRWLASTSFEILDVAEGEPDGASAYVLKLEPRSAERFVVERTPERRGPLRLSHVRVRTRFPFGILEKTRSMRMESEALVFPELVDVSLPRERHSMRGHEVPARRGGSGAEVVGLRDHRSSDTVREIHWRRTAALGKPVSRERSSEADELLRLELHLAAVDDPARARFERAVSEVASLAVLAVEHGRPVEIRTHHGVLARAHVRADLDRLLRELALITSEPAVTAEVRR